MKRKLLLTFFFCLIAVGTAYSQEGWTAPNSAALQALQQGRLEEAAQLFSVAIREAEKFGPEDYRLAQSLNGLAETYRQQEKFAEAEPLYRRLLPILEKAVGPEHTNVAISLNNLAETYRLQKKYAEAEPLYRRSLAILERTLGRDHSNVATSLNNLAVLLQDQEKYSEAEALYRRSLPILERTLGPEHPDVGITVGNLANVCYLQKKYAEAEPLYRRALYMRWRGPESSSQAAVGDVLDSFATIIAITYFRDTPFENALRKYKEAVQKASPGEDLYVAMAHILLSAELSEVAEEAMQRAAQAFPNSRRIRFELADL